MTKNKETLKEILKKIKEIDFRKRAELKVADAKILLKHYLIIAIEEILNVANVDNVGICKSNNFSYTYNGKYWERVSEADMKDFLGKAAQKMGINKFDAKFYQFIENLYKQFMSSPNITRPNKDNETLINLNNGTFAFSADSRYEKREHNKEDFQTYVLPFDYDPQAKAPLFQNYLNRVLPEKELQDVIAEYLGHVFINKKMLKLEQVLFCYGTGANGKSVLFEIVYALLGKENVTNYSLQKLTDLNGQARSMIADKLINYSTEVNNKIEHSLFKQLASGEPVEARLLYQNPEIIENYAKLIFNCNELPRNTEQTEGFFRRFLIVPFEIEIPIKERDTELASKIIKTELSGVFNWVLGGLERVLANKRFTESAIIKEVQNQFRTTSDSVLMFIQEEGYEQSIQHPLTLSSLYPLYKHYTIENGYIPVGIRKFADRLRKGGFQDTRLQEGKAFYISKKI